LGKIVFIILFNSLFLNCETKKEKSEIEKTVFYYPRISSFESNPLLTKISLDSIKNFGELTKLSDRIACNGKIPVLKFSDEKSEFNLILFKMCSKSLVIADYSGTNVISIENNSIIINDQIEKPFDSLKTILKKHILNQEKESDYSINIEKALIFYYQDSLFKTQEIKKQLIKISTEFNKLNSENGGNLPLKIKLSDYPYIRILNPQLPDE
jgi:hypothetical protein